jgi:serine/threonine-protein kinase RsbW
MSSERAAVGPVIEQILTVAKEVKLSRDRLSDLAVALAEALSNAAIHGNKLDPRKRVQIRVSVLPGVRAVIDVKDEGHGFEWSRLSDPTRPGRLLRPGGRGVFLMRQLVDRVEYLDGGSRVLLWVERRPRAEAQAEAPP